MGIIKSIRASSVSQKTLKDPGLVSLFGGSLSTSGQNVTADTAMGHDAVFGCVRILAETMAQLPLHVYKRIKGGGKEKAVEHPLYDVLHNRPNKKQTSFEWREMQTGHSALRGNAYSHIVSRNTDGRILELIPLHPDRILPFDAPDGSVAVRYMPLSGKEIILLDSEVLRMPGMSFDGLSGMSPISAHRETIGVGLAQKEYGSRFFANNATPKGGVKIPAALDEDAVAALRNSWNRRHQGIANSHELAIFDGGMEWVDIGMTNEDAQYLEGMKFNIEQIARIFRVPLILLQSTEKATSWGTGIEQFMLAFIIHTIMPWVVRQEQRMNISLLSEADRRNYFIGYELKGLMRGDADTRKEFYKTLWSIGAMSGNEIRELEDMNPVDGLGEHYVPLNMAPVGQANDLLMRTVGRLMQEYRELETGDRDDHRTQIYDL